MSLFGTVWCLILDLNVVQVQALVAQARREGLLNLRAVGAVVEITFPRQSNRTLPSIFSRVPPNYAFDVR